MGTNSGEQTHEQLLLQEDAVSILDFIFGMPSYVKS